MSDSIKVAIKVRPLIKREKDENLQIQWAVVDNVISPVDPEKKRGESGFQFDHIFDSAKTNNDVFETVVKPIVNAAVRGFNGTVFAYGQTSSGKTHTMLGTSIEPGIIPMAVDYMFDSIAETCGREFLLRVSYLEIYNEKVNDLLDTSRVDLKLREDSNGLVQVLNCKEDIANSPDLIMATMKKGDKNRRIGETDMNERSSRSHTIFRITIESRDQVSDSDGAIQVAQLNLVDLAGSERARQTNATGERFKEGTHINMSLSTLGLVIKQLSESSDSTKYINFRDSKLTRLLQASLGGNAMTVIICAVTPAAFEETQCTLSFASRAKSVQNKPQLNEVMSDAALLKRCKKQIAKLHAELEKAKHEFRIKDVEEMESKLQEKEHKLRETDRMNQLLEERIHLLENNIISTDNTVREYNTKKLFKSKRRRTWAGDRALYTRFSLNSEYLPTIKENPSVSPDSKLNAVEKHNNITRRKSIIQTVDLNNESFETAFADFELDMIKVIKEREEETNTTVDFGDKEKILKGILKTENRVKFLDDVEIHRLSSGSNWSDVSTPEKQKIVSDQEQSSPGTPKSVLRQKLHYITEEYYALQEYTSLERQTLFVEKKNFESVDEKIFMQNQIFELLERLRKCNINETDLHEQLGFSLNCINEFISRTPEILELWKQSLFDNEKDEENILTKLKELQELLKNLKNGEKHGEKLLTPLEKKLTNDYNTCLKDLEQLQIQNDKIVMENNKLKKEFLDESNKLKNSNILMNTLRIDTDCLMKKLLEKDSEISKLKERIVELERVSNDSEKSIRNMLEISIEKGCDTNLPIKSQLVSDINQNKDDEILKLNEIIQEQMKEIMKYKQFEEEMKSENESLKQTMNTALKVVQMSKECQTEVIIEHEDENKDEKNMINEISQQKNDDISKLSKLIEEKDISIKSYQQLIEEKEKKIEELDRCLDSNKVEKISQECQTEDLLYCESENNSLLDQTKSIEISNLLKKIEEKDIEIENYKHVQKQKTEKTEKENELIFLHNFEINKTNSDSTKDIEISRLENIIQDKSLEIQHLQFCLNNENKIEKTSKECQVKHIFENKILEVSQIKSVNVEMYDESNEEIKLEFEQSQEHSENINKDEQMSEEYKKKHFDKKYNKDNEIESQHIIQQSILEIEKYKQTEEELKNKIEWLQQNLNNTKTVEQRTVDCQTESLFKNDEQNEIDLNQDKNKEMNDLIKKIQLKELENVQFKQSDEEKGKEIDRLQQCLDTITNIQRISKDCQTEYVSDIIENVKVNTDKEEDNEILRLSKIIEEKSFEISVYKQLEKENKKEIESLKHDAEHLLKLEHVFEEVHTEEVPNCDIAEATNQLEIPNQIAHYQEEIKTLLITNAELEEKVTGLNNKLIVKMKDIDELTCLINTLKNEIIKKTQEMSSLTQSVEIKIQKLEQKFDNAVLEKNELKAKINSLYSSDLMQNFKELNENSEMVIKELTSTNNKIAEPMNNIQCISVIEENVTSQLLDSDSFLIPNNFLISEQKDSCKKLNTSATMNNDKSFVKPLNKKCELESSSIFANISYFDDLCNSQSFVQDCTSLAAIDETKDISNISTNISTQMINHVMTTEVANNTSVLLENSTNVYKLDNNSVMSPIKFKVEELSMEEFERIKKENSQLHNDLQKYIQQIEEFQGGVIDVNESLRRLQQTVNDLTTENMELSKKLNNTTEEKHEIVKDLQIKINTLTDRLSSVSEEKASLQNELAILNEQFETMRAVTPVITDDELKSKLSEYHEKINKLTEENIELSTNLMEKIEELEKVKESQLILYDHQCSYRKQCENLNEKLQYLEKENIELSSNLTDHIEECDKLKETSKVLQQQLEAYKSQSCFENSNNGNPEFLKEENLRLTCESIELKSKISQLSQENSNLSINIAFDKADKDDEFSATNDDSLNISSIKLEVTKSEDVTGELNSISTTEKNKQLQKEVENLILLNKKLVDLKLQNCHNCEHLKEINESRRRLKLEVQLLNQKLANSEKKFQKLSSETEVLKAKANEDFNTSFNLIDSTFNSSNYDGLNITLMEEKVRNLQNELEESKENHNKLSSNFKEKCNELDKLQSDTNSFASPLKEKENKRLDSNNKHTRLQICNRNFDKLSNDINELKKSFADAACMLNKWKKEQVEVDSLTILNEELKTERDIARSNALNSEEKVNLLEDELAVLYKQIETTNLKEKTIEAQKLEIEVKFESLFKEKEEIVQSLHNELKDCKAVLHKYEEENINLKNELQKVEGIIHQLKEKNVNNSEKKLEAEIEAAKSRMMNEIKSLIKIPEDERKQLSNKSVTDIFLSFLNTIISKEQEMVKNLHEDYEKIKRRLEDEKQQSIDSEKRTKCWAQTVETDFEKAQADLTEQEHINKCLKEEMKTLNEYLNEVKRENQRLQNNIHCLETEVNSLTKELNNKFQGNEHRDAVIKSIEEKERLARTIGEELENRLKHEKEEYELKLNELNAQLGSYKSSNDDLKNNIEGLDLQIEHYKNTIDIKTNEFNARNRDIEIMIEDIENLKDINEQLKIENSEKNKHITEITDLLKIKCDLLTEYKTKVETMKPEYESLRSQIAERETFIEKRKEEIHCLKMENKKQIDILQDKLSAETIKSEGLNNQLREWKNKNTALHSTLEECKDRCGELERENQNLQRKVRNSTSKVRVEKEMKDLQDENRSLKNHLEGSYNRIKELQESKSQVQMELTEVQGKNSLLEQELNTTKISLESLREKYNNMNLQKLRDQYEVLLSEKNRIILEIEDKKMLIANKDQKLVEFNIEMDTLKKQKEALIKEMDNFKEEKLVLEKRILNLLTDSDKLKQKIAECNNEKDEIHKVSLEEKNQLSTQLENCQKKLSDIIIKNKELDDEMEDLVKHIHEQENEIADLQDRLITGSSDEQNIEKLKTLEEDNEKLKIDLRVTELNRHKLENEVIRLNSEKELLVSRIEDLNSKIIELKSKNNSRNSSKSNSPTSQKGRRRHRRSDLYNQNRNLDLDSDGKEITDIESPSTTPTPSINSVHEECKTCYELRNRIREMSLDHVTVNNKITMLEVQLQAKEFPYQIKCNELQENLLAIKTRNSELKLEIKKLQRALMEDCSRECHICRHRKHNKRDQSVQANPETKICLTGMSSGIVEDHLRLEKMEKERNWMKDLCRNRARKIKELEQYIRELEGLKTC